MEQRNKGLIIFGIILLVIGLVASFYPQTGTEERFNSDTGRNEMVTVILGYPYQTVGILLDVAGIVFVALGFLYSPRKTLQQKTN
jgi:drug/metabolite transporter (DMT)-like permease